MADLMDQIVSLAKRRGFIYPSSEIYGGFASVYDYGPLGVAMKNNLKKLWWQSMVWENDNIVGLDSAIFMHPKTWEASGHIESFTDPLVECKQCHHRFRADHVEAQGITVCPDCGGQFTSSKKFNLLVKAYLGTTEDAKAEVYLRGETCQGIYLNYKNILATQRLAIPFGIAQIGKAFRNEISPGNFTYRTREFEQMEMQFFIKNDDQEAKKWFAYWKQERLSWYLKLGLKPEHLRLRPHAPDERAHYANQAEDIEYQSPFGWQEFEGIHNRGDWDLSRHQMYSGEDLRYADPETKQKYTPWIIETSAGVERSLLFFLLDAYSQTEARVVLKLDPRLAPYQLAVFPLLANKKLLVDKARSIYANLKSDYAVAWDDRDNIGKRYYAQDEIGTPWCLTVDHQTLADNSLTIRDRDTTKQERLSINKIKAYLATHLAF